MVTKPVMVQKLHCYREQTKAEVYSLKKIIVRNRWKSAQEMWWKLCQVVVPALCAADICASNAETFPRIAPGEDSTVPEEHRRTQNHPHCDTKVAPFRRSNLSSISQDTLGNPTPPVPHCPSEKQRGLCFCVPEHPLLPHTITLPQPKNHKCNTVSSYTFSFCCLFSLLYTTVLAVILIPSHTAFHQLQTCQSAGKDLKASEERGSLS